MANWLTRLRRLPKSFCIEYCRGLWEAFCRRLMTFLVSWHLSAHNFWSSTHAARTLIFLKNHVEETCTWRIRPSLKLFSESFVSPSTAAFASAFSPFSAFQLRGSEGQRGKRPICSCTVVLHRSTVFNVGCIFDPFWACSATAGESLISLWESWTPFCRIDQNRLHADILATVVLWTFVGHEKQNCTMLNPRLLSVVACRTPLKRRWVAKQVHQQHGGKIIRMGNPSGPSAVNLLAARSNCNR